MKYTSKETNSKSKNIDSDFKKTIAGGAMKLMVIFVCLFSTLSQMAMAGDLSPATGASSFPNPVTNYPYIGYDSNFAFGSDLVPIGELKRIDESTDNPKRVRIYELLQIAGVFLQRGSQGLPLRRDPKAGGPPAMLELSYGKLVAGGRQLRVELVLTHPLFSGLLDTHRESLRIRYKFQFEDCDNVRFSSGNLSFAQDISLPAAEQISNLIQEFQALAVPDFFRCHFNLSEPVADAEAINSVGDITLTHGMGSLDRDGRLMIYFRPGSYFSPNTEKVTMNRRTVSSEAEKLLKTKSEIVRTAAKRFVNLIKKHGNIIIESDDLSAAEKSSLITASINGKRAEILELIKLMNENLDGLSYLDQFAVTGSVNQAYRFLKEIEVKVGQINDRKHLLNLGTIFRVIEE
jgi:hypothetical protein